MSILLEEDTNQDRKLRRNRMIKRIGLAFITLLIFILPIIIFNDKLAFKESADKVLLFAISGFCFLLPFLELILDKYYRSFFYFLGKKGLSTSEYKNYLSVPNKKTWLIHNIVFLSLSYILLAIAIIV